MNRIQLCSGILRRGDQVLLVRVRYPAEPEPLWTLPGGRQERDETIAQTVAREFWEECGLRVRAASLAYVSESIDPARNTHVLNCTFRLEETRPPREAAPRDPAIVEARFVTVAEAPALLRADVLRIPVAAALSGDDAPRYFAFRHDEIDVPFFSDHRVRIS